MNHGIARLAVPLLAALVCAGCASSGPPLPPSLELPARVTDLHAERKGNRVYLNWTVPAQTTDHETIRRYGITRICRGAEETLTVCGPPAGTVAPPAKKEIPPGKSASAINAANRYTDQIPSPADVRPENQVTYAVELLNPEGRSSGLSNQVRVPLFPAAPPPEDFAAKMTAEGVNLSWKCTNLAPQPNVQYHLRVNRKLNGNDGGMRVADVDLTDCANTSYIDSGFEWEKTYDYFAFVATTVSPPGKPELEIDGDDTPGVQVVAHDIFPPAVPSGLQAVFSGAGQPRFIDLIWTPDSDADLAGYNLYRHEEGTDPVKLNPEPVKISAYRDSAVQAGRKYFYSVSAVDVRGNESPRSDEANERVP